MNNSTIANKMTTQYMLVSFHEHKGKRTVKDKQVAEDAEYVKGADSGVYSASRKLWAGDGAMKELMKKINQARNMHGAMTVPYGEVKGQRMIKATTLTTKYIPAMQKAQQEIDDMIANLEPTYDQRVQRCLAAQGSAGDPSHYVDYQTFKQQTGIRFTYRVVPSGADFRNVNLPAEFVQEIALSAQADAEEAAREAVYDACRKATKPLEAMVQATRDVGENNRRPAMRDTLTSNLQQVCSLIEDFNLYDNPQIAQIVQDIRTHLCKHEPAVLRVSETARVDTHNKAKEILGKFNQLGF